MKPEAESFDLHLDRDRGCYDFVKWWFQHGSDTHYDFGNTGLPYLNGNNADAFEPTDAGWHLRYADLSQLAMVCLVKLRLFDLEVLDAAKATTSDKLPTDLIDQVRSHVPNLAARNNKTFIQDVESVRPLNKYCKMLNEQTAILFAPIGSANPHH